jgi:acyl carrier protein
MNDVRADVRAFVRDRFLALHPGLDPGDEDDLLALGVIDSLGFVELVEHVEARFGIAVQDVEITEEHFGSIAAIARFVEADRAA